MTIIHIELAKTGSGVSGGEISMLEQAKCFAQENIKNIIVTTDNGKEAYIKNGLLPNINIQYFTVSSAKDEKRFGLLIAYIIRSVKFLFNYKKIVVNETPLLISQSCFFPNTFGTLLLRTFFKPRLVAHWYHGVSPRIMYGYQGEFTNKKHFPGLKLLHLKLNEFVAKLFTAKSDLIIVPNNYIKRLIAKAFPTNEVYCARNMGGSISTNLKNIVISDKHFDILWMGRFQKLKNLEGFLNIIALVKKQLPQVKALIIGAGSEPSEKIINDRLSALSLTDNINFAGWKFGEEKNELILKSKLFVSTSIFESHGLVIPEVMSFKLPVIAYALPSYENFACDGLIQIPINKEDAFATEIVKLLKNQVELNQKGKLGYEFSKKFNWNEFGKALLNQFLKYN